MKTIFYTVLAIYLTLAVIHLSNGFHFGSALAGPFIDFRAFTMCFGEWGEVWTFIDRPSLAGQDLGSMALSTGECR